MSAAPGATTFDERVPLLTGPDDPLVGVVETLIKVADSRSRRERATLLVERLADIDGFAAVPLLTSLRLRADWAAADERACAPLARLAAQPVHRPYAARRWKCSATCWRAGSCPTIHEQLDGVAEALREILDSDEANTRVRLAALEALGHLLALKADVAWAREVVDRAVDGRRDARRTGRGGHGAVSNRTRRKRSPRSWMRWPDCRSTSRRARSGLRRSAARPTRRHSAAERVLLARLERSIAARQSLEAEIEPLGRMRSKESLPLLLAAAGQPNLSPVDRQHIAWALGRLGDDRAVPVLIGWLRGDDYHLKEAALAALENLDSQVAAREVRPLLKSEAHLPYKLRIARLLARHGMADGYALATEHLADDEHTAAAALVLAALDDPRTSKDLSAILAARPDRRWHAAALTGLAAIGDAAARKQLLDILADDRNPLAADAAEAAGLAADERAAGPVGQARAIAKQANRPGLARGPAHGS